MTDRDVSNAAWRVGQAAEACAQEIAAYHATWASALKPRLTRDGNAWCALHGADLMEGISGFGPTPALALAAFEIAMCSESGAHIIPPPTSDRR